MEFFAPCAIRLIMKTLNILLKKFCTTYPDFIIFYVEELN